MKTSIFKRLVALTLTLLLVVITVVPSFAVTAEQKAKYKTYVALGDSIASGYAIDGLDLEGLQDLSASDINLYEKDLSALTNNLDITGYTRAKGSYPDLVAKALDAKLYQYAWPAWRTDELRYMLEADYEGDEFDFMLSGPLDTATQKKLKKKTISAVKKADVVTIGIGCNNLLLQAVFEMLKVAYDYEEVEAGVKLRELIGEGNSLQEIAQDCITVAEVTGIVADVMNAAVTGLVDGVSMLLEDTQTIVKDVHALNSDATVLFVGYYNPLQKMRITDYDAIPFGTAFYALFDMLNLYLQVNASINDYIYVDVTDTEVMYEPCGIDLVEMAVDEGIFPLMGEGLTDIHPTKSGHAYMANQILAALPE